MIRQPEREQLNCLTVKTLAQVFIMRGKEGLGCSQVTKQPTTHRHCSQHRARLSIYMLPPSVNYNLDKSCDGATLRFMVRTERDSTLKPVWAHPKLNGSAQEKQDDVFNGPLRQLQVYLLYHRKLR